MKRPTELPWKFIKAARDRATSQGEAIAHSYGFTTPPVDPLTILAGEQHLIHAEGYNFGKAFDGRIRYVGPRFLLTYNTRYDEEWPHQGKHHSKVLFTICHELGHFYLSKHR